MKREWEKEGEKTEREMRENVTFSWTFIAKCETDPNALPRGIRSVTKYEKISYIHGFAVNNGKQRDKVRKKNRNQNESFSALHRVELHSYYPAHHLFLRGKMREKRKKKKTDLNRTGGREVNHEWLNEKLWEKNKYQIIFNESREKEASG